MCLFDLATFLPLPFELLQVVEDHDGAAYIFTLKGQMSLKFQWLKIDSHFSLSLSLLVVPFHSLCGFLGCGGNGVKRDTPTLRRHKHDNAEGGFPTITCFLDNPKNANIF